MDEPAAQHVLAKLCGFLLGEIHAAGFDDVGVGELEERIVEDFDHVGVRIDVESGQSMNSAHELAVCTGRIHRPARSLRWKEVSAAEFRASKVRSDKASKAARSVFCVCEPREVELRGAVGRICASRQSGERAGKCSQQAPTKERRLFSFGRRFYQESAECQAKLSGLFQAHETICQVSTACLCACMPRGVLSVSRTKTRDPITHVAFNGPLIASRTTMVAAWEFPKNPLTDPLSTTPGYRTTFAGVFESSRTRPTRRRSSFRERSPAATVI